MASQRTPINPDAPKPLSWWQKRFGDLSRPLKWSLIIHGLIALLAVVGLPKWGQEAPLVPMSAIAVDLVNMGEYTMATNTAKKKGPNNLKPAQPKAAKAPEFAPAEPKPEPKAEPPELKSEPEPAPKTSEPKPEVEKEKVPDKKAEKEPEKKPEKKPQEKEKPKKEDKPKADDFDSVLKNLSTEDDKPKAEPKKTEDKKEDPADFDNLLKDLAGEGTGPQSDGETLDTDNIDPNKPSGLAPITGDSLSISSLDALQYQLARCWNPPAGAADAQDLIVEVRIVVRQDRTVESATIVDTGRYASDAFFRAAADSARRAVLNPNCSPLVLPPEKYDIWKNVVVRFNPKQMLGG